jgi:hypothetical protein
VNSGPDLEIDMEQLKLDVCGTSSEEDTNEARPVNGEEAEETF